VEEEGVHTASFGSRTAWRAVVVRAPLRGPAGDQGTKRLACQTKILKGRVKYSY